MHSTYLYGNRTVPDAVEKAIPQIEKLVQAIVQKMQNGGRLFYIGAGTSGRLGVLDASECPPTYGVPKNLIIGIIAGGDVALRNSVESAEDNQLQAWHDLKAFNVDTADIVVGIAASGTTPYVIEGLKSKVQNINLNASDELQQFRDEMGHDVKEFYKYMQNC